ncbi:MAG: ABC transporter permease subunit, partial [Chloroflexi bacterium]|nr:ABC transporter permease subunit [Chloroflexota bacterium]
MSTTARGEVFDIGYQHYEGPREGRSRARRAIYKEGLRMAMGIGRGGRAKLLPWAFIIAAAIPALVFALIAGTIDRLGGGELAEAVDLPTHSDYYGIAGIILLIFSAAVGPELLCPDRRDRVIDLYLVRPLTGSDYIIARWLAFLTIMTLVAWLPQFVLLGGLALGADSPTDYFKDNWLDTPRFLASGFALALYTTTLALLVASFTNRRAYAAAFIVGLYVISLPFAEGMSRDIGESVGKWIALINLSNVPIHVNDIIFGEASGATSDSPAKALSGWILFGWYLLLTVVPFGI